MDVLLDLVISGEVIPEVLLGVLEEEAGEYDRMQGGSEPQECHRDPTNPYALTLTLALPLTRTSPAFGAAHSRHTPRKATNTCLSA